MNRRKFSQRILSFVGMLVGAPAAALAFKKKPQVATSKTVTKFVFTMDVNPDGVMTPLELGAIMVSFGKKLTDGENPKRLQDLVKTGPQSGEIHTPVVPTFIAIGAPPVAPTYRTIGKWSIE